MRGRPGLKPDGAAPGEEKPVPVAAETLTGSSTLLKLFEPVRTEIKPLTSFRVLRGFA